MNNKPLILYHANCTDGFCAAWSSHRKFGDAAEYRPINYGDPVPDDVAARDVYLLDFSFEQEQLRAVAARASHLYVLDHHKSRKADVLGMATDFWLPKVTVRYADDKSGGRLAWEHFFPNEKPSWLVDFTEDRDLWRWKLHNSKEISAAIASHPFSFDLWDRWAMLTNSSNGMRSILADEGAAILRYQAQQVANAVRNAREIAIAGHRVKCVCATTLISEIGEALAENMPFGATYFDTGVKRIWSLRSRGDGCIDVSEIARKFGGGGHRQSAGFQTNIVFELPHVI